METQEIHTSDPCPKGIVNQLLEIAKENDAMNEIGGATGWRWQEGIISRMPKKQTVAKVLKKAYGTNDPELWSENTTGDLKRFIKNSFGLSGQELILKSPRDVYETLFLVSLTDAGLISFEELVYRMSDLKFYKEIDIVNSKDYFEINDELVLSLNKAWAEKKVTNCIDKFEPEVKDGLYFIGGKKTFSDSVFINFYQEIMQIRHKKVHASSIYDMWRTYQVNLTDREMIDLEYKLIDVYEDFVKNSKKSEILKDDTSRTRMFSFSGISLSNKPNEVLK